LEKEKRVPLVPEREEEDRRGGLEFRRFRGFRSIANGYVSDMGD
jgi:hypothetical protein